MYARANIDLGTTAMEGNDIRPLNVSIDRCVSGHRGGAYTANNMAISHVCCNLVKGSFTKRRAIGRLLLLSSSTAFLGDDGFLQHRNATRPPLSAADEAIIDTWCRTAIRRLRARHATINTRGSRNDTLVTLDELQAIARKVYGPSGQFVDATGLVFSLREAEVDRLDPTIGYSAPNIRLLLGGLNWCRSNTRGDRIFEEILDHLKIRRGWLLAHQTDDDDVSWKRGQSGSSSRATKNSGVSGTGWEDCHMSGLSAILCHFGFSRIQVSSCSDFFQ